ncbi:unnamed protein product [Euphydryas editha]|uniref:Pol-like protein n=1 Tax=Euphydryas editha TaxID=104508 RepID=A0AAU9TWT9_EUPED|nr:unnamed protein product [Euphydryas editha]
MVLTIGFKLNIIQWNCQSLIPKLSELDSYLHNEKVHICILSETWLQCEHQINLTDYSVFRKDRADGYAGLAILVHQSINCCLKTLPSNYNNIDVLCLELLNSNKLQHIIGVYSPTNITVSVGDYQELFSHFSEKTLIVGDFNAHHTAWSYTTDTRGRLLSDTSINHNYVFLNNGDFTRCAKLNDSIICTSPDISFCSADLSLDFDWNVTNESLGSDHLIISIKTLDSTQTSPELKRNIKKANWVEYTQHIESACEGLDYGNNVQSNYDKLIEVIEESANKNIPYIKTGFNPNKFKPKPWWNPDLSKAVAERRLSLKNFRKLRTVENYLIHREKVIIVRKLIKLAKRNSWQQLCDSIDYNMPSSEVWRKLRWLKGYRSPKHYLPESTAVSFLTELTPDSVSFQPVDSNFDGSNPLLFTFSELILTLKRVDTSAGLDTITYSMISHLPDNAKKYLLHIFNTIYKKGEIPEQWRRIKLIAIPKRNTDKYRPISLINCLCKTFNLMITRRLEHHFESNKLFNGSTLGFRRGLSCQDNLSRFIVDTETAFIHKKYVLCAYGDISNAYNNLAIEPLITSLVEFDVDPLICRYIREFLKERVLIYRLRDGTEITRISRQGLAQGDPMSPILFNIVTIKLCNTLVKTVKVSQYADDFAFYCINQSIDFCANVIQSSLNIFITMLQEIGLEISLSKTKVCILTRKYKVPSISIRINNTEIKLTNCTKFLGMWVDSRLNWTRHVLETAQKCTAYVNILSSISSSKWGVHPSHLRRLYLALVRSRLDYGCIIYGNANSRLLQRLDVIQNQCLRLCGSFIRDTPIFAMESELCIPPLSLRRIYLSDKYFLKLSSRTSDHLKKQLEALDNILNSGARYWRKNQIPLLLESFRNFSNLPMSKFEILPQFLLSFDIKTFPWDNIIVHRVNTINESKAQLPIHDLKQHTEDMIDVQFSNYIQIYTDGSKTRDGSSCAFYDVAADFGAKFLIENSCIPIMGVELTAINEAVHYIESTPYNKIVIFTDSKSSLQHLLRSAKGGCVGRNEAYLIIKCIHRLIRSGVEVRLQWIPSHVGVRGNEVADSLASKALQNGIPLDIVPHYTDHLPKIKNDNFTKFKSYFNECSQNKGFWYRTIVGEPPREPWFASRNLNRKYLTICFRTRTYHIPLNKFNFIMKKRDDPNCTRCEREEDLLHLVLECKINEQSRLDFLNETRCSTGEFLFFLHQILSSGFTAEYSGRFVSFIIDSLNLRSDYYKNSH